MAPPEKTAHEALDGADALVLMTAHREFVGLDLLRVKDTMHSAVIVDGRRIFDPDVVKKMGFMYRGVGATNQ